MLTVDERSALAGFIRAIVVAPDDRARQRATGECHEFLNLITRWSEDQPDRFAAAIQAARDVGWMPPT